MAEGIVNFFNPTKGVGFIRPFDGGEDVLVLGRSVARAGSSSLVSGQKVVYDLEWDRETDGVVATNLRIQQFFDNGH